MAIMDADKVEKFFRNDLTKGEMISIEQELIESGDINAAYLSTLIEFENQDEIDDLIGVDEDAESVKNIDFFSEFCEKVKNAASIVINTQTFNKMKNFKLNQEEMTKVTNRYHAITAATDTSKSLKENLVNYYISLNSTKTAEEANSIVTGLIDGCNELTEKYNTAMRKGFKPEVEISTMTADMSTEERFLFLVNAIATVETLNVSAFGKQEGLKEAIETAVKKWVENTTHPTDADCDVLQAKLANAVINTSLLINGTEQVKEMLQAAGKDTATSIDFASKQYDDAKMKAEMALAGWIEYEEGNLPSIPAETIPKVMGVSVATAVEEAKVMNDVANGSKTVDMAVKCLKVLGGVALTCLLGYGALLGITYFAAMGSFALLTLLGSSGLAVAITFCIMLGVSFGLAKGAAGIGTYVVEKAGKIFDIVVKTLRENVLPQIVAGAKSFIAWVKSKFTAQEGASTTTILTTP